MDPNQEGQPQQGGSVPPTSPAPGMPPAQAGGSPAPTSGMPPAQPAGTPPAGNPVFGTQGTTAAAGPAPTPVSTPAPAPGVLPASGAPATPPLTPRRSFRPASAGAAQAGTGSQFAQPDPSQPGSQIIASGNLPTAGNGKKPSRNMIIAIVAVAVLAIVAVIIGIVASNSSGSRSNSSSSTATTPVNMTELATAYNNLANYIAFGDENQSEGEYEGKTYTAHDVIEGVYDETFIAGFPKADEMLSNENVVDKTRFFSKLDQLYQQLPANTYDKYNIDIKSIHDYYSEFSSINYISEDSIISRYNTEGFDSTRTYIENNVTTKSDDRAVVEYAKYMREYDLALLDLINDVKTNKGCTVTIRNTNNCNIQSVSSYGAYKSALDNYNGGEAYEIKTNYRYAAMLALVDIYNLLNNSEGSSK